VKVIVSVETLTRLLTAAIRYEAYNLYDANHNNTDEAIKAATDAINETDKYVMEAL
jgi:hypothetical protein